MSKAVSRYEIDMCNGPLLPGILRFALPLIATNVLQLAFNAADMIVVGKFSGSDTALAAVGLRHRLRRSDRDDPLLRRL